ncbi:MAG: GNAT family N-acetyltransferase [Bacteroidota bacterium]
MPDSSRIPFIADLQLARRLESTDAWVSILAAQIHAQLHPDSASVAEPIAGGHAVFTGVGSPLTQAIGIGLKGPVTESDMERLEAFFEVRGSPTQIELCPLADPTLMEQLSLRGYRLRSFSNMLVRPLKAAVLHPPPSNSVSVQKCGPGEADVWTRTVAQGFAEDIVVPDENASVLKSLFLRSDSTCLLAWLEGRPVGGGALAVHEGVAAFYGASTLPSFRRRGVQKAIIQALLAQAVEEGCDVAYTLTVPGSISQRNVERQLFRVVYTRAMMVKEIPPK